MKQLLSASGFLNLSKPDSIRELATIYDNVITRLRECADYRPGIDEEQNTSVDTLESNLQALQEELIKASAKTTLKSEQDLKDLLDFWHVVTVQNAAEELTLSDRIIMNIRDYFDEIVVPA